MTTSFTSSGTFSVPTGMTVADVLVVAGGGGTQSQPSHPTHRAGSGGGGAGGLIFMPEVPVVPQGTVAITVGCGGAPCGQDSVFGASPSPGTTEVLTAKGGGGGGSAYQNPGAFNDGKQGGSGGGGNRPSPGGGNATQPTQPGNSGAYGFGNVGGAIAAVGAPYSSAGGGGADKI